MAISPDEPAFGELVRECQPIIEAEIRSFQRRRRSWRLEPQELRQEALLQLWKVYPLWLDALSHGAFCRVIVRRALGMYARACARDPLYGAVGFEPGGAK